MCWRWTCPETVAWELERSNRGTKCPNWNWDGVVDALAGRPEKGDELGADAALEPVDDEVALGFIYAIEEDGEVSEIWHRWDWRCCGFGRERESEGGQVLWGTNMRPESPKVEAQL